MVQSAIKPIRVLFFQVMLAVLKNKQSTFGYEEAIFFYLKKKKNRLNVDKVKEEFATKFSIVTRYVTRLLML